MKKLLGLFKSKNNEGSSDEEVKGAHEEVESS